MSQHQAALRLDFVIVGAGVSGLAVAYTLATAGHRVRVLERQSGFDGPAGGVRLPPNASKILCNWAGVERLEKSAIKCTGTPWYNLENLKRAGYLHWKAPVLQQVGGDFYLIYYQDLVKLLHELAVSAGAKVDFNAEVTAVTPGDPEQPTVTLASGEVIKADMVVGADGPLSIVRKLAFDPEEEPEAVPEGMVAYAAIVPASVMLNDPELAEFMNVDEWTVFFGPNRSIGGHPTAGHTHYAYNVYWPEHELADPGKESWEEVVTHEEFGDFPLVCEPLKRLLKQTPVFVKRRLLKRPEGVENWVDDSQTIALIGEAAHPPFVPGALYHTSLVLEDALVFGALSTKLQWKEQIPLLLRGYAELQEERRRDAELLQGDNVPKDAEWDEESCRRDIEETFQGSFIYDVQEAVEDWWQSWGRLDESLRQRTPSIYTRHHLFYHAIPLNVDIVVLDFIIE
ncbi:hypothetical protein C8Q75DRAFT_365740 [Abortiporus biennis]|nr:hypothetical protein C8Q75DRAFT_365740 [Abortiporus biennis]